ncbi:hypothetical protein ANN_11035 [Periplaneta americana]|uniref:Uncharacterized protein n=1 Tax=Periplaneta americana TaxID=6978 RepID=A0ABQ8T560_PERAM|nr:hypothetical protein ANN_11035 [Periplaneta americana]
MHHKNAQKFQNRHLSLSESFEIINSTVEQLNRGRGKVADAVRAKVDTVLSKNPGYEELQKVVAVMSGESTVKINLDLSPADIVKLNYVPVTSCDVERSFSQYKSILRDNRRRFTFQHLKEMFHFEEEEEEDDDDDDDDDVSNRRKITVPVNKRSNCGHQLRQIGALCRTSRLIGNQCFIQALVLISVAHRKTSTSPEEKWTNNKAKLKIII